MDDGRRLERFAWALLASEFGLDPTKRFERTEDPFGTRGPFPLLHDACRVGDEEMVAYLVEMGCDPMEFDA